MKGQLLGWWGTALALAGCGLHNPSNKFDPAAIEFISTPQTNYLVRLSFENLDIKGFSVEASARYHVINRSCVAMDMSAAVGGLQLLPEYELKLPVLQSENHKFDIAVSLDPILDEDYFGLGVCKWSLDSVTFRFSNGTARFVTGVDAEEINAGQPVSQYFLTSDLAKGSPLAVDIFGEGPDYYLAAMGPQFRVILQSSKASDGKSEIR